MRLAATVQSVRRGPGALPARQVVRMATREGARALGLDAELGSLEAGKRADFVIVNRDAPHLAPGVDPYSLLVYSATAHDVRTVVVDGEVLVEDGRLTRMDALEVTADARHACRELMARAGL
jgi:cytosine/adenosine deaminase-related metal-dependent hydrolase